MKLIKVIILLFPVLMMSSCNFLDFDETSGLDTREANYMYFENIKSSLTNVYSFILQDFGVIDGAMRDCATGDAEYGNTGADVQDFNNGNWSAVKAHDNQWDLYSGVRAANEFLESIAEVDLSRFQYDTRYQNWEAQLELFPYEARVLRAFYFFELARRYGDIVMPLKRLTPEEANTIEKTPFNEVISFIVAECNACKEVLPESYVGQPNNEVGRITKGFAMALKSKALLYAASELHNPSIDKEKWKLSATAALDLINTGIYQLDPGIKVNNLTSPEVVLFRMNGSSSTFERNNFPVRFTEGTRTNLASATFPSQNLVDAFETVNGYTVTLGQSGWECDDPAFDPQNPYDNRDPRFARTILANGMDFKGSVIETYVDGQDFLPVSAGGTPTGYFLRKYIQESTNFVPGQLVSNYHHWVIYRYAETLLTYAESMVQAFDDPDYSDGTYTMSARAAINQVRSNAGMPDIMATDKSGFIESLQNEWRVEFAFEDHRFWDIRRWKIGRETQTELYGVSIDKYDSGALSFQKILYESRSWNDRMYLYPIPQEELFKNPNLSPQNPGWN